MLRLALPAYDAYTLIKLSRPMYGLYLEIFETGAASKKALRATNRSAPQSLEAKGGSQRELSWAQKGGFLLQWPMSRS